MNDLPVMPLRSSTDQVMKVWLTRPDNPSVHRYTPGYPYAPSYAPGGDAAAAATSAVANAATPVAGGTGDPVLDAAIQNNVGTMIFFGLLGSAVGIYGGYRLGKRLMRRKAKK